jgi:hypothetical protein
MTAAGFTPRSAQQAVCTTGRPMPTLSDVNATLGELARYS